MLFFEYSLKAAGKKIHASFVKFMVNKSPYWDIPSIRASSAAITFRTLLHPLISQISFPTFSPPLQRTVSSLLETVDKG
jgi:hypothetical protein